MDKTQFLKRMSEILEEVKVGVLCTVDAEQRPDARWMTFASLGGHGDFLYCVSSPQAQKCRELEQNSKVTVLLQTKDLNHIIKLKGIAQVVDNPSLRSEIIEALGKKLFTFWKINEQDSYFVVLEISLHQGQYLSALEGKSSVVEFA
jgi:general stress protein 26